MIVVKLGIKPPGTIACMRTFPSDIAKKMMRQSLSISVFTSMTFIKWHDCNESGTSGLMPFVHSIHHRNKLL